ncbi:septum formation initiator family protein [Cohnella lubricantis]|uniref:Septum formation initiator family protein n=1 Tax=Cohnella lubricantis TaxID=2163172 RepID=A0A841TEC1_9BACL|nr:septum formation initiator family protein [Cohnella lubricantis]MBB6677327.1 septum formation initiator family protein [Cohnella lubricantis]MBP2116861.1 cell division protein FtsL [Cohnella lubricantis]
MQYYGNLALQEERKPSQPTPRQRGQQAPQLRRRSIPVGEKLLYMLTVMVLVAVSSLVIYRYASLYQLNREIQLTSIQYEETVQQSKELQREVEKLRDPNHIQEKALQLGLQPQGGQPITLSPSDGSESEASGTAKP